MQPPFNLLLDPCDEADNLPQCPILRYMQLGPYDTLVCYYIPCNPILPIDADLHMVDWVCRSVHRCAASISHLHQLLFL